MSLEAGSAASAGSSEGSTSGAASTGSPAAPAQSSSPAPQTGAAPSTPGIVAPQGAAPAAWAPNWKFKAAGKEHEIPEYLRGVVKDAQTEKQLKELHERAYGLDLVKGNYQTAQQQLQHVQKTIMPEYQNLRATVDSVIKFRNAGDMDSVLETVGIKPEAVAQWMLKRLQMNDMTPEQKAVHENEQRLRKENYALQDRMQTLSQSHEQTQLQVRAVELQTVLARPEVQSLAENFNTRMGAPDAFWNYVCQQADYMERSSGQRVTADQAIQRVVQMLGNGAPAQAPVGGQQAPHPQTTPPVIPNVTGASNTSPTRKVAKSLDDLRKLHKEMASQR